MTNLPIRHRASRVSGIVISIVLALTPASADAQQLFEFHSGFWMNLHHYLHALGRPSPLVDELPQRATESQRTQWARAVEFYRTRFGKRALVFDAMLVGVKRQLIEADTRGSLEGTQLTPEHRQVLETIAPIYRSLRWPDHDVANKTFIATLQQHLARHGAAIAERLARSYDDQWPAQGFRVDVVRDAGPPGNAYTTTVGGPTHITLGADDLGLLSLELIFHESSHHWDQQLMKAVDDASKDLQTRAPPNLWHALLFYNAGQITADVLAAAGVRNYTLYMVHGKVFDAPGWHASIAKHWSLFLAGKISRAEAIARILRDLAGA